MNTAPRNYNRVTARISASMRETLETAAKVSGVTVSQFISQAALREAERMIEQEFVIRLSANDAAVFVNVLDNPPPLNTKLMTTLRDYALRRDDRTGAIAWAPRPKQV